MIQKFVEIKSKKVGQASFIASTPNSDRYDDVIDQNSWILEGYKNNPVILLNHRQDMLPIGRATKIGVVNGQLEIDVEFDMEDELGANVARKVDQGFLKAVSVGFQPKKGQMRSELPEEHKAFGKSGMFYSDNELLEVSVVTIPANSEAIAKSASPLHEVIRQIVRSELLSKPSTQLEHVKHILEVEEQADRFIVSFAKHEEVEEVEEPVEEAVEEEPIEELEDAGYGHDEDEEKNYDDEEDEETNMKSLIKFLLS